MKPLLLNLSSALENGFLWGNVLNGKPCEDTAESTAMWNHFCGHRGALWKADAINALFRSSGTGATRQYFHVTVKITENSDNWKISHMQYCFAPYKIIDFTTDSDKHYIIVLYLATFQVVDDERWQKSSFSLYTWMTYWINIMQCTLNSPILVTYLISTLYSLILCSVTMVEIWVAPPVEVFCTAFLSACNFIARQERKRRKKEKKKNEITIQKYM